MGDAEGPPDRYNIVYFTFLTHGIGVLTSWNMFINAFDYFIGYKLSKDYIGYGFEYNPNFMQFLTFCSQVPATIFSWLNIFVRVGGSVSVRVVVAILIQIVIFLFTILLAMVDTSKAAYLFFFVTLICVVLLNSANAIYQNSVFGITAKLPGKYTGAIILGNNICGTFASVVSILSKIGTKNLKVAAIYYFITALFMLLVCLDTYFALPLYKFYRYYDLKEKKEKLKAQVSDKEAPPYWTIFKKSSTQLANVFMLFFVTLAVFPAVTVGIQKSDPNFWVPDKFYTDIMCFLCFNVFALIGSWLPSFYIWPKPELLWIPVVLRFAYIPLLLLCNYQVGGVDRKMPILIKNDWVYLILAATMALTSGYFSSLAMMYAPGTVEDQHASIAGMLAGASLITGIFIGILVTFFWPLII